jgi:hypothetical protein
MRIAYLNPWSSAAENQCYASLAIAARRTGIELIDCRDENDLEPSGAEFVISHSSSVPKICDYPTYLIVQEPPSRFLANEVYFQNLASYDGYLTVSDSVGRFLRDLSFGIGRPDPTGFFFTTAQKSELRTPIPEIVKEGKLQIVYFGTNWDRRWPQLLELLDTKGILRIHGPAQSWPQGLLSYAGPLPFDGIAPQRTYCSFGMGLILQSADHVREDVITNRIFEISSVGAVAVCPDMPWIRKWYGDSVFYFDPWRPTKDVAVEIMQIHEYCKTHPAEASKMGDSARAIFEKNFPEEMMLSNAVEYHTAKQRSRRIRRAALGPAPLIAVIMRCGGRDLEYVKRAVASVGNQSFGRYALVFVKYKSIDLSQVVSAVAANVERVVELDVLGGNRSATLFAGLAKLRDLDAEYFSVLDDDDFWLSNHMESLFSAGKQTRSDFDVAFSGSIAITSKALEVTNNVFWKRNISTFGYRGNFQSMLDITAACNPHCFVARIDLIPEQIEVPDMETAEDSVLSSFIARRQKPIFSYQATAFIDRSMTDGSNFQTHPHRLRDEMSWILRSGLLYSPNWLPLGSISPVLAHWQRVEDARRRQGVDGIGVGAAPLASADLKELSKQPQWRDARVTSGSPTLVQTVSAAWGYSALLPLVQLRQRFRSDGNPILWEVEAEVNTGEVGFGLFERNDIVFERLLKATEGRMTIYLPAVATNADLMVRNGASTGASQVAIYHVRLVQIEGAGPNQDLLVSPWPRLEGR